MSERVDHVVLADGSGGTHAGLLAGLPASVQVLGVDVGTRPDLDETVPRLASAAAAARGTRRRRPSTRRSTTTTSASGYGAVTDGALEAIDARGASRGPRARSRVHGQGDGRARSARCADGRIAADETVVFWHTGGAPALFSRRYADCFETP